MTSGPPVTPLWSAPLPTPGGGSVVVEPTGGCAVTTPGSVSAYASDGRPVWSPAPAGDARGKLLLAADGVLVRIEGGSVVVRDPRTGAVISSMAAPMSSTLAIAPWGELLYSQVAADRTAAVRCISRTGQHRWQVPLDPSALIVHAPFGVGDAVVIPRRGALWAYDRDGEALWVADPTGVRAPHAADDDRRSPDETFRLSDIPARLDANRVIIELEWYSGRGLYLLDGAAATITPIAVPSPVMGPHAVLPWAPTEFRVVGLGSRVQVSQVQAEHPVVAIEPGGAEAWRHGLVARAVSLCPTPNGNLIVASSPEPKRWRDYHKWYDLSAETFVRCLGPDGSERWTWYAPGLLTHLPVVTPTGTVYVGSEQRLWALQDPS
ncbi:PQQ-binding-like beta-propeller repeat protein [Planosporangium flavigriseum]|nr:PQQ-binding-like beta-propeller repeat protein [Planosporangium flavigriseum]